MQGAPVLKGAPVLSGGGKLSVSAPITVLVVEDSVIVRERLVGLIEELPHEILVREAAEGHEARRLFERHRFDAVVLDLQLPGIGGLELLEQFKRDRPDCPVVVLTTYALDAFRQRCHQLGADHFFSKAHDFERVPEVLRDLAVSRSPEGGREQGFSQ